MEPAAAARLPNYSPAVTRTGSEKKVVDDEASQAIHNLVAAVDNLSRAVTKLRTESHSNKTTEVVYRLICEHCLHPFDIPENAVKVISEPGGYTYFGECDPDYLVTTAKCTLCAASIHRTGSVEQNLQNKSIFRL